MIGELALKDARALLGLYRQGRVSPTEVVQDVVARAAVVEPHVNAFTEEMFEEALSSAARADDVFLRNPERARPLEGIPVAVKEKHSIRGRVTREGSLTTPHVVAPSDAPVVERVRDAGGIIHARTATPEFNCAAFTHSRLWGITRNPWNLAYSPGGSSGGSAAALAAGSTVLATASDIGGSTRIPAGFCGVVGYKPPYGRVPGTPPGSFDHYRGDGPLARSVSDLALMYECLAGQHPDDPASLPGRPVISLRAGDVSGMRVAFAPTLGDFPVEPDVARNAAAAAEALAEAGAVVSHVDLPWSRAEIIEAAFIHWGGLFGTIPAEAAARAPDEVTEYAAAFGRRAATTIAEHGFRASILVEARLQQQLSLVLREADVLLCPTNGTYGFEAGDEYLDGISVNGEHLDHYLQSVLTVPFNLCNRSPVIAMPSGLSRLGIPTSVQVVGRPFDESTVFRTALALERRLPWHTRVPRTPPGFPAP